MVFSKSLTPAPGGSRGFSANFLESASPFHPPHPTPSLCLTFFLSTYLLSPILSFFFHFNNMIVIFSPIVIFFITIVQVIHYLFKTLLRNNSYSKIIHI